MQRQTFVFENSSRSISRHCIAFTVRALCVLSFFSSAQKHGTLHHSFNSLHRCSHLPVSFTHLLATIKQTSLPLCHSWADLPASLPLLSRSPYLFATLEQTSLPLCHSWADLPTSLPLLSRPPYLFATLEQTSLPLCHSWADLPTSLPLLSRSPYLFANLEQTSLPLCHSCHAHTHTHMYAHILSLCCMFFVFFFYNRSNIPTADSVSGICSSYPVKWWNLPVDRNPASAMTQNPQGSASCSMVLCPAATAAHLLAQPWEPRWACRRPRRSSPARAAAAAAGGSAVSPVPPPSAASPSAVGSPEQNPSQSLVQTHQIFCTGIQNNSPLPPFFFFFYISMHYTIASDVYIIKSSLLACIIKELFENGRLGGGVSEFSDFNISSTTQGHLRPRG